LHGGAKRDPLNATTHNELNALVRHDDSENPFPLSQSVAAGQPLEPRHSSDVTVDAPRVLPDKPRTKHVNPSPKTQPVNLGVVFLAAIIIGAIAPRVTGPSDAPAREAFAYVPPPGFAPLEDAKAKALPGGQALLRAWSQKSNATSTYTPNITLAHAAQAMAVEDRDLGELARQMPTIFAAGGTTWREVRHGRRVRADGAHVGLIEGECSQGALQFRSIQIIFPDDTGTSIVTGSFPLDQADKLEAPFEATIADAKGVAKRVGPIALWRYAAWAIAGGILAYFSLAMIGRGRSLSYSRAMPPAPLDDLDPLAPIESKRATESAPETVRTPPEGEPKPSAKQERSDGASG
jgi:hypothetical protein